MSSVATYSFSSELIEQQNTINLLLCELDEKINSKQQTEDLKEYVTDLIDKISGNHDGIQGDLNSLLISFKSGLITSDELEKMIIQERDRSNFLMSESMGMSKQMKFMFAQFEKLIQSIDETDPVASNAIDNMNSNMHSLLNAIDTLSEVVASPGNEVHSLLESTNKFEARSFDDSPRMSDPKRFQGSRKSINKTVPNVIEVPLTAPIHIKSTPSQYKPGVIVRDDGIVRDDCIISVPINSKSLDEKNDASCQTTLSNIDFIENLAVEIPEPIERLLAAENLLIAPPHTPVKGVERLKNGSSSKTTKRPNSIKKKSNTSRSTVSSMLSPSSRMKSAKESKKDENAEQEKNQREEQEREQEQEQQSEAALSDLSHSAQIARIVNTPPTDPIIVRHRSQDRMQSASSGLAVKPPNSAGRREREVKVTSSITAGPGPELVLGPGSSSDLVTQSVSLTQSAPLTHTIPVTQSISATQSTPLSQSTPVTQSKPVTHFVPVTQLMLVTQSAPLAQPVPVTYTIPVAQSKPVTQSPVASSMSVALSVPVTRTTPVTQSALDLHALPMDVAIEIEMGSGEKKSVRAQESKSEEDSAVETGETKPVQSEISADEREVAQDDVRHVRLPVDFSQVPSADFRLHLGGAVGEGEEEGTDEEEYHVLEDLSHMELELNSDDEEEKPEEIIKENLHDDHSAGKRKTFPENRESEVIGHNRYVDRITKLLYVLKLVQCDC
jgi:hypothetical protein